MLIIFTALDLCYDKLNMERKPCNGDYEDGSCDDNSGSCNCKEGYKLDDGKTACVEGMLGSDQ